MKQSLFWVMALSFALVSCSKEIKELTPTESPVAPTNAWTVSASIENASASLQQASKANLDEDDLQVLWQSCDTIGLVDLSGTITPAILTSGEGTATGSFVYYAEEEISIAYAFYPYQKTATVAGSTLNISLSNTQNFPLSGGMVPQYTLIMAAKPSANTLVFKNCCAIAKIQLNGTENYARKLYVSSPDFHLCGEGTVDLSSDTPVFTTPAVDEMAVFSTEDRNRYVIGNINGESSSHRIHVTPSGEAQVVCIVLPPAVYTSLSVEALGNTDPSSTASTTSVDCSYTTDKVIPLNAGKIRPLNVTLATPASAIDLSDNNSYANCYMLTSSSSDQDYSFGTYYRDINSANTHYNNSVGSCYYATLLWESSEGLIGGLTYDVTNKRVYFERNANKEGNALIAVRLRGGQIVWSWHIWVSPDAIGTRTFNGNIYLDRNIGAMAATASTSAAAIKTNGLYYQWGRKDPFPGPADFSEQNTSHAAVYPDAIKSYLAQDGVTLAFAKAHPYAHVWGSDNNVGAEDWNSQKPQDNNLWGNWSNSKAKLSADPCPYGYRVPNNYGTDTTANSIAYKLKAAAIENYGLTVTDDNGLENFFPCGGWMNRKQAATEFCQVGKYCRLWTMTSSTKNDILNTDYIGAMVYNRYGTTSAPLTRSQARRWAAQIRCVQFDESSYTK